MAFHFSDSHIESFFTHGYTVFKGIIPDALLTRLRAEAEKARQIAHRESGHQAQRLQPLHKYDALDWKPFQEFGELPGLRDALTRVLSPRHQFGTTDGLGILFEPVESPYCTAWHRDWRDNGGPASKQNWFRADWESHQLDHAYFNQVNCPLYEDSSTWVVPGSHLRKDLAGEAEWFRGRERAPVTTGKTSEEAERICAAYCHGMPGAQRLHLEPGDFALYRNCLWHLGCYVPYRRRATLVDFVDTPEYATWREAVQKRAA